MTKRLVPFRFLPASWGLVGKAFDEAEAYYSFEGEKLDRELVYINHKHGMSKDIYLTQVLAIDLKYGKIDAYEYDIKLLEIEDNIDPAAKLFIDAKHGKITPYDVDKALVELNTEADSLEREKAILEVNFNHGKLTKNAYDKHLATIDGKPWIGIVDQGFDMEKGVNGVYFEFDWNSFWIEYLRLNGYMGVNEEELVEHWFQDVCRATSTDNPDAPPDEFEGVSPISNIATRRADRLANRVRRDDGTFYR